MPSHRWNVRSSSPPWVVTGPGGSNLNGQAIASKRPDATTAATKRGMVGANPCPARPGDENTGICPPASRVDFDHPDKVSNCVQPARRA